MAGTAAAPSMTTKKVIVAIICGNSKIDTIAADTISPIRVEANPTQLAAANHSREH